MKGPARVLALLLAAVLLLPACDSSAGSGGGEEEELPLDPVNLPPGTFEAVVSGDVRDTLRGDAAYTFHTDLGFPVFSIDLDDDSASGFVDFQIVEEVPQSGRYPIAPLGSPGFFATASLLPGGDFDLRTSYRGRSGEVAIISVEDEAVTGRWAAEMRSTQSQRQIEVSGAFHAVCDTLFPSWGCL